MEKKEKSIILIENKYQASEYLKNIDKYGGVSPISFSFEAEQVLLSQSIPLKIEEQYEKDRLYYGIHPSSIKITNKIVKKLKIDYREINLFDLFYYDIYLLVTSSKKYMRLLKEVLKKEKPSKIITFQNKNIKYSDKEYFNLILPKIYKGNIEIKSYSVKKEKEIREKKYVKLGGYLQKLYAKIMLNLFSSKKKIFIFGGKTYFRSLSERILRDDNKKIFNFDGFLRKSYFVQKNYLPFYEFSGIPINNKRLQEDINKIIKRIGSQNKPKEYGIEHELSEVLEKKIISLIKSKFKEISEKIEEMHYLMKKNKIDLILSSADTMPLTKSMVELARQFKIPSVVFQHGFFNHEIGYMSFSTNIFSSGEKVRDKYVYYGADKNKIDIVGCPRYDEFKPSNQYKKYKTVFYGMEVTNGNEVVADTHLNKKRQKEILRSIFSVMKKFPNYKLIIKTRPNWELAKLPKIIADEENFKNLIITAHGNNLELMGKSDLIIINRSTLGVEAMLLDKPVVSFYYKDLDNYNPYYGMKFVKKIYNEKQLESEIKNLGVGFKKNNLKLKKALNQYFLIDRKSSKRALKIINGILNKT